MKTIGQLLTERAVVESCLRTPEGMNDKKVHDHWVAKLQRIDKAIHARHTIGGPRTEEEVNG